MATTPGARGAAEMLSQADLALYAAKGAGKGRWRRYEPGLHLAAVDRLEVRTELERAIALGSFALLYQPIVDLGSGVIVGVEALVRWRHPRRGIVAPGDFIHVAEETGLVVPLGSWVLDCALADLARWRRESAPGTSVTMSVNVSALQVRARGFLDELVAALAQRDVPAESLILEITETALLADDERASADLAALRELGLHIAIDDFGTGYSSLDYLRRHAIDVLKIDRSFINGIESSGRQAALVGAIVHLAAGARPPRRRRRRRDRHAARHPARRRLSSGSGTPLLGTGAGRGDRPLAARRCAPDRHTPTSPGDGSPCGVLRCRRCAPSAPPARIESEHCGKGDR